MCEPALNPRKSLATASLMLEDDARGKTSALSLPNASN